MQKLEVVRNRINKNVMCDASSSTLSQVFINGIAAKCCNRQRLFEEKMKLKVFFLIFIALSRWYKALPWLRDS